MDRYTLLVILNAPFVFFGLLKAFISYRTNVIKFSGLLLRFVFWITIFTGLLFAKSIYLYLIRHNLTDSSPLSVADVVQTTGIIFSLSLILRLYSKIEANERKLVQLQQKISVKLSKDMNSRT